TNTTLISIYFIAVLIHEDPPTPLQQFFSLMPQPPSHLSTLSLHDALPISITVTDEHHSHDNGGYCEIRAADGGTIHIPSLTASTDDLCISLEGGTVDLTTFGSTDDETFKVVRNGGEITGIDPGAYDLFEVTEGDEAQAVHFATRGAPAQAHDRGLDSRAPMSVEDHPNWDDVASSATDERVK